jgi:hypothetical protein
MDVGIHGQDNATGNEADDAHTRRRRRGGTLVGHGFPFSARRGFAISRCTTDAPFVVGRGEPVIGPIQNIVLVLAGRPAGLAGLCGSGRRIC